MMSYDSLKMYLMERQRMMPKMVMIRKRIIVICSKRGKSNQEKMGKREERKKEGGKRQISFLVIQVAK